MPIFPLMLKGAQEVCAPSLGTLAKCLKVKQDIYGLDCNRKGDSWICQVAILLCKSVHETSRKLLNQASHLFEL